MKICFLFIVLLGLTLGAQKPIVATAKVEAATVYFNSVEISQSVNINLPNGTSEIIVKNVSDYVNEETVLVGVPKQVSVLSVQYTTNYISEYDKNENSSQLKEVKDSILWVTNKYSQIKNEKESTQKTIELLDANQKIVGSNGINSGDLIKVVEYYQTKRTELSNSLFVLERKEKELSEKLTNLKNKLSYSQANEENISQGKLVLQLMNSGNLQNIPLQISYISGGASWQPFYDLRAESISQPIQFLYKAQVVQQTGVDWKNVKLTLSSGMPSQNNRVPELNPWFLYFQPVAKLYRSNALSISMPEYANEEQVFNKKGMALENRQKQAYEVSTVSSTINENQLNTSFDIPVLYNILSNGKQHSVVLNEIEIPASYKYFAVPKLDKDAYLLAQISNYSQYNLLKGEANIIFEGLYVGKTVIDPNQTQDTLSLGMGRDKRVTITREKIADKSGTRFLSSSKEQTFTYDIVIKNNKKNRINLTIEDQYPLSTDENIKIELMDKGGAKVDADLGKLTWDLVLAANEIRKIRISYKVKSPKNQSISNL
ncbi:mucoidy inhibitor MuiA family protein [Apibacter muscae]|uniref:Mucoidy inhibitor MuiA family protein n=1 Tax=Apibacter muscae TaxID=2509004 RepID=A0A563DKB4_9FLAO|nr:DUF4139 domain-containing protein [Apibacter muscae]TWP30688.1 mucoidy inhibitor MuiA family protein [Apibacter muscae]